MCQNPQHTSDKKPTSVSFANELQLHVTRNWPIYESLGPGTGGTCISDVLPAFLSPLTLSSNNNVKDRKIDSRKERGEMQGEREGDRIVHYRMYWKVWYIMRLPNVTSVEVMGWHLSVKFLPRSVESVQWNFVNSFHPH